MALSLTVCVILAKLLNLSENHSRITEGVKWHMCVMYVTHPRHSVIHSQYFLFMVPEARVRCPKAQLREFCFCEFQGALLSFHMKATVVNPEIFCRHFMLIAKKIPEHASSGQVSLSSF